MFENKFNVYPEFHKGDLLICGVELFTSQYRINCLYFVELDYNELNDYDGDWYNIPE